MEFSLPLNEVARPVSVTGIALECAGKIVESMASVASIHLSQSLPYSG